MNIINFLFAFLFTIIPNYSSFGAKRCADSFKPQIIRLTIKSRSLESASTHASNRIVIGTDSDSLDEIYRYQLAQSFSEGIHFLTQEHDWSSISEISRAQRIAELQFKLEYELASQLKSIQSKRMRSYQKSLARLDANEPNFRAKGISILAEVKPGEILSSNADLWIDLSRKLSRYPLLNTPIEIEFDPWLHNY